MSTDRELLEMAAKAAGYSVEIVEMGDDTVGRWLPGPQKKPGFIFWQPLREDGDALRLAVQCGIEVSFVDDESYREGRDTRACAGYCLDSDPRVRYVFEDHRGDIFAATRRAIVRAAADIGKAMP